MRMNTTLVINPKGGSGKTTVTTNLASHFAAGAVPTTVMDYDPQGSSLNWLRLRAPHAPRIHAANGAPAKAGQLRSIAMHVPPDTRQLIIDAPAGASGLALQDMLSRAHCILIPVAPSAIDIHATANFIRDLLLTGKIRANNIRLGVVANRVRKANPVYEPLERFLKALNLPLLARVSDSETFVSAAEGGLVAWIRHPYLPHAQAAVGLLAGVLSIGGFGDNGHVGLHADDAGDAFTHETVIVDTQDSNWGAHGYSAAIGTAASIVVPAPGLLTSARRPRSRAARSRIVRRPRCSPDAGAGSRSAGTNPQPLSVIVSFTPSFSKCRMMWICVARPCLTALATASCAILRSCTSASPAHARGRPVTENSVRMPLDFVVCSASSRNTSTRARGFIELLRSSRIDSRASRRQCPTCFRSRRSPSRAGSWDGSSCVAIVSSSTPIAARL